MTKYVFPKGFLWGGAIAAHQAEGGKGLTTADLMPIGQKRWDILMGNLASFKPAEGEFYPSYEAIDFYHRS
ncbi:family 1 glycosylhydrolase [Heyndrickxia oleronia]|nr:family 1 glycosylhydrolase [Heyndrickxia oleronia]